jgi:hypothetical protein
VPSANRHHPLGVAVAAVAYGDRHNPVGITDNQPTMSTKGNKHPLVNISKHGATRSANNEANWKTLLSQAAGSLSPSLNGAAVLEAFAKQTLGAVDLIAAVSTLNEQIAEIQRGDMTGPEAMLYAQATALQSIFVTLSRKAIAQEYVAQYQTFMSLAFKAQAQCRATLEALNEIKFPRSATFVKQANIANQQQVNNSPPARGEKEVNRTNELLEEPNHEALDHGATQTAGQSHSTVEAVGEIEGTNNRRREEAQREKCP